MSETWFTREHEWVRVEGDIGVVGISEYAQEQLGDVVFVELPHVGAELADGDQAGVVESVKAASEIYSPVSGEVIEVNDELVANPALVNDAPLDDGWFFKIKLSNAKELDDLMDPAAYDTFVKELQ